MSEEQAVWDTLERHLKSVFAGDSKTYRETTSPDLSLYEWWVTPHRQDGLDFHEFMIDNRWSGAGDRWRYDLLEKRCQLYGDTAIVSYTFMLSIATDSGVMHQTHNESRVLVKMNGQWKIVHVHKSPAYQAPREA